MTHNNAHNVQSLPDGWVWASLPQLGELNRGKSKHRPRNDERLFGGPYPFIQTGEIGKAEGTITTYSQTYGEFGLAQSRLWPKGTLCITIAANIAETAILGFDGCFPDSVVGFIPEGGVNVHFVEYFIRTAQRDLERYAPATAQKNINLQTLRGVMLPLPPLPEQHRIVAEIETQFTRLDAAVAALKRAQANLQRYKASVLKAACEGRLLPPEELEAIRESPDYEPADVLLQRILAERRQRWEEEQWQNEIEKAKKKTAQAKRKSAGLLARVSDLADDEWQNLSEVEYADYLSKNDKWKLKYKEPDLPDTTGQPELKNGWCWTTVDQISWLVQYGTSQKANLDPSGIPVLRMGNIQDGELDFGDLKYFPVDYPELSDFVLQPGDILFNRTNSAELVGKTAIYKEFHPKATFASYLIRVKVLEGYLSEFLSFYINSVYGRQYIASVISQQVGQANVNGTKLKRMTVPFPPLAEQRRIVEEVERCLSVVAALEAAVEANLRRAERLRQSILKRAFEGRLVPQDPDDEPASGLLERIQAQREAEGKSQKKGKKTGRKKKGQPKRLELL